MTPSRWSLLALVLLGCAGVDEADELESQDAELSTHESIAAGVSLRVNASRINLRASGSTSAAVVTVLDQGQIVKSIARSGESGWVNVETAQSERGWILNKYVDRSNGSSTATCAASRGAGIVGRYQKALHDSIAFAEGTEDFSKDGYDVMFSFKLMSSCASHPNQCLRFGGTCSTAAGRYQILKDTWDRAKSARNLGSFEPENQERAAEYLISNIRRVTVPQSRAMTATEFSNALSKLSYEWASLPPGRHGQPIKTRAQMRTAYCGYAGC